MGDDKQAKQAAKAQKKAAKESLKALKKAGTTAGQPTESTSGAPDSTIADAGPTPAERSAAAAEQAVAVNRRRFTVQVIAAVLTLCALLIALWSYLRPADTAAPADTGPTTSRPAEHR